jgi:hypothetical protein
MLVETTDGREPVGWWQIAEGAGPAGSLVIWNDLGPWVEDQAHARTLVRVYAVRATSDGTTSGAVTTRKRTEAVIR